MKKIILVAVLMVLAVVGIAQQDTLWKGVTATYYKDMYDDDTKQEKAFNFSITFRKDSIILFNDDRKEKDYILVEVFTERKIIQNQEVIFYSGRTRYNDIILITLVREGGQLAHLGLSNGTYLVIFHVLKLIDMEALKIHNEKDSIYTNNYNNRISSSPPFYEGVQRSPTNK